MRLRSVILALCNGLRILRKHGSEGGCAGTDPQGWGWAWDAGIGKDVDGSAIRELW